MPSNLLILKSIENLELFFFMLFLYHPTIEQILVTFLHNAWEWDPPLFPCQPSPVSTHLDYGSTQKPQWFPLAHDDKATSLILSASAILTSLLGSTEHGSFTMVLSNTQSPLFLALCLHPLNSCHPLYLKTSLHFVFKTQLKITTRLRSPPSSLITTTPQTLCFTCTVVNTSFHISFCQCFMISPQFCRRFFLSTKFAHSSSLVLLHLSLFPPRA